MLRFVGTTASPILVIGTACARAGRMVERWAAITPILGNLDRVVDHSRGRNRCINLGYRLSGLGILLVLECSASEIIEAANLHPPRAMQRRIKCPIMSKRSTNQSIYLAFLSAATAAFSAALALAMLASAAIVSASAA